MKVYVSGPMSGLVDLNYPAFRDAQRRLEKVGFEVLNPARIDDQHLKEIFDECRWCRTGVEPHPWTWYMLRALKMLCDADALALLPNWQRSRGARIEVEFASAMQIPIGVLELVLDRHRRILVGDWDK